MVEVAVCAKRRKQAPASPPDGNRLGRPRIGLEGYEKVRGSARPHPGRQDALRRKTVGAVILRQNVLRRCSAERRPEEFAAVERRGVAEGIGDLNGYSLRSRRVLDSSSNC